jgi:hypothetical protein
VIGNLGEAGPAVKPQRRIEFLDQRADGFAARASRRWQSFEGRR